MDNNTGNACTKNIITFGCARFTFLTERLVRMEWARDQCFEDRLTLTVANRETPPVRFTQKVSAEGRVLLLETAFLRLQYTECGQPFSRRNLEIRCTAGDKEVRWTPGMKDRRNLGGTLSSLDLMNGPRPCKWKPADEVTEDDTVVCKSSDGKHLLIEQEPLGLGMGLLSRSGWSVIDDSGSAVLDPTVCSWQPWPCERPAGERQDLYFLGYGLDYRSALADASLVFGHQPLPPRYALGYWYSRYGATTDKELQQLVRDCNDMNIPLDVLVIDRDWHQLGWTGYAWDRDFFPEPESFLQSLHQEEIKISLNLHPAEGISDQEPAFPAMKASMGLSDDDLSPLGPDQRRVREIFGENPDEGRRIPFDNTHPGFMRAYFDCLHHPLERKGVDFWWMDWQESRAGSKVTGLHSLPWINELHWQDQQRRQPRQRPLNFTRYGGLGSGRRPVGFSGETIISWESLAFQPYFTATANNVLFGTWSHDIGGCMDGELTGELYTRWMQFGAWSPILRTHTGKALQSERRVFHYPEPFRTCLIKAIRDRYRRVPYLYGEMRKAWECGVSAIRPLYIDWPELPAAYRHQGQYCFGDDWIVSPVVHPAEASDGMTEQAVWLPPGKWFDTAHGLPLAGKKVRKSRYTLAETPAFVRAGAIIPEQEGARRLLPGSYPSLAFTVYPGRSGSCVLYEDDGISVGYQKREFIRLKVSHQRNSQSFQVRLHGCSGTFDGFLPSRPVSLRLEGVAPPREVFHGRLKLPFSPHGEDATWSYDGDTATVIIRLGTIDISRPSRLRIVEADSLHNQLACGLKGLMTRLETVRSLVCSVSQPSVVHRDERLPVHMAQTGNRISRRPDSFPDEVRQLHQDLRRLPIVLRQIKEVFRQRAGKPKTDPQQVPILDKAIAITESSKALLPD